MHMGPRRVDKENGSHSMSGNKLQTLSSVCVCVCQWLDYKPLSVNCPVSFTQRTTPYHYCVEGWNVGWRDVKIMAH